MPLYLIRLELARDKAHPDGSHLHGYELYAPLDAAGHLDITGWRKASASCTLRRFWGGEADQYGQLIHTADGVWAFSYDPATDDDDEPVFRLDHHVFRLGEYVTVSGPEHGTHTFRVAAMHPVVKPETPAGNLGVPHGL